MFFSICACSFFLATVAKECNCSRGKLQVAVENDFLFEKVVDMREQINQYSETFLEYEGLTTKLTDLNLQMVAENAELKGQFDAMNMANKELESTILRIQSSRNSNQSNAVLHETVRSLSVYAAELEKEVSWLQVREIWVINSPVRPSCHLSYVFD